MMSRSESILLLAKAIVLLAFANPFPALSQQSSSDLIKELHTPVSDSVRTKILLRLAWMMKNSKADTSMLLMREALSVAKRNHDYYTTGGCYQQLGVFHYLKSDYDSALHYYDIANKFLDELQKNEGKKNKKEYRQIQANIYNNISLIYQEQSNFSKALQYSLLNLRICEECGIRRQIASAYSNVGIIYRHLNLYEKAGDYFDRSLQIAVEIKDDEVKANVFGNLGTLYQSQAEAAGGTGAAAKKTAYYHKAIGVYRELMRLDSAQVNMLGLAADKASLGAIYLSLSDLSAPRQRDSLMLLAQAKMEEALDLARELQNGSLLAEINLGIGILQRKMGFAHPERREAHLKTSCGHLNTALELASGLGDLEVQQLVELNFSKIDSARGNFSEALKHFKSFIRFRDSISNESNTRKQTQLEMQYEFDKKQLADSVRVAEEKKVAAAELRAEKNKGYTLYGGLGLVTVFAAFLYNRFRVIRKQKEIIEEQKKLVEEQKKMVEQKNIEVLDSIHYARRIQQSLLPTDRFLRRVLGKRT